MRLMVLRNLRILYLSESGSSRSYVLLFSIKELLIEKKNLFEQALLTGHLDKNEFGFKHTILLGDLGGALLNSFDVKERPIIEERMEANYITSKQRGDDPEAIVLGKRGSGKVRLILNLVKTGDYPLSGNLGDITASRRANASRAPKERILPVSCHD
jgi:hypothetical protein